MSLKAFHIFFIAVSVLTAFGFGAWAVYFHFVHGNGLYFALGLLSFVVGGVLVVYGLNMLRRFKRI